MTKRKIGRWLRLHSRSNGRVDSKAAEPISSYTGSISTHREWVESIFGIFQACNIIKMAQESAPQNLS